MRMIIFIYTLTIVNNAYCTWKQTPQKDTRAKAGLIIKQPFVGNGYTRILTQENAVIKLVKRKGIGGGATAKGENKNTSE